MATSAKTAWYGWKCTCGRTSLSLTAEQEANRRADEHEEYCRGDGEATVVYER